jgi:RNA polymerase sigma-70 factor (ECF subfamily)
LDILTDELLIAKLQSGVYDAAGELYNRYKQSIFAFFVNYTNNRSRSEDLVQLTFERVIKYSSNYQGKGSFRSWLYSIARNVLVDEYRKKHKNLTRPIDELVENSSDKVTVENDLISNERAALLHEAINKLDPEKRELLSMIKLNEMKYREVAELYNMNESTVKVRIFRIMNELKNSLSSLNSSGAL